MLQSFEKYLFQWGSKMCFYSPFSSHLTFFFLALWNSTLELWRAAVIPTSFAFFYPHPSILFFIRRSAEPISWTPQVQEGGHPGKFWHAESRSDAGRDKRARNTAPERKDKRREEEEEDRSRVCRDLLIILRSCSAVHAAALFLASYSEKQLLFASNEDPVLRILKPELFVFEIKEWMGWRPNANCIIRASSLTWGEGRLEILTQR